MEGGIWTQKNHGIIHKPNRHGWKVRCHNLTGSFCRKLHLCPSGKLVLAVWFWSPISRDLKQSPFRLPRGYWDKIAILGADLITKPCNISGSQILVLQTDTLSQNIKSARTVVLISTILFSWEELAFKADAFLTNCVLWSYIVHFTARIKFSSDDADYF